MILGIRTDSAEATLVLDDTSGQELDRIDWTAGRQLSDQLLIKIEELLKSQKADWENLTGVVAYQGPGSFTGLRIGITVANTIAFVLNSPVVGVTSQNWVQQGVKKLTTAKTGEIVRPEYGAEANISKPTR